MQSQIQNRGLFVGFGDPLSSAYLQVNEGKFIAPDVSDSELPVHARLSVLKHRSLSESSEDFIVFDSSDSCIDQFERYYDDEEDDSDASDESDQESDDEQQFGDYVKQIVFQHNKVPRNRSDEEEDNSRKKVKFNLKPEVHTMVQWDFAYRAARKGPWETYALDRSRFKSRIDSIDKTLGPVLSTQHRSYIWQQRFEKQNDAPQENQTASSN